MCVFVFGLQEKKHFLSDWKKSNFDNNLFTCVCVVFNLKQESKPGPVVTGRRDMQPVPGRFLFPGFPSGFYFQRPPGGID